MNILFITQLYPLSENSSTSFALHYFVKEWQKNNNVQVIRPWLPAEKTPEPTQKEVEVDGVSISIVKPTWLPVLKISLVNKPAILKTIKFTPDVIICHLYNSYFTFGFLKDHFKKPFVLGIHISDVLLAGNPFQKLRIRNAVKKADVLVYRSPAMKTGFEKKIDTTGKNNIVAVSGISQDLLQQAKVLAETTQFKDSGEIKFISVCRLLKLKQIDKVIASLAQLKKEGFNWSYTIIGEGPEQQNLVDQANKLGLENQINFTGKLPRVEVYAQLKNHAIFVMPSSKETLGLVYLEAMACGCIVIGSENRGIDGIVIDGQNGFLCNPSKIKSIVDSLKTVFLSHHEKLNQIRTNSLQTIQEYGEGDMARNYLKNIENYV